MKTENKAQIVIFPLLHGYTKEFYDWCQQRELRFQRCQPCGTWRHLPRPRCHRCHSLQWEWAPTKGKGKVYCWTTVHQALDPAFTETVPYAAVVVELDEGPRLATWVTAMALDDLRIGMAVELWFDIVSDEVA